MASKPCLIPGCPALANGGDGLCRVHRVCKRLPSVDSGVKCPECRRLLTDRDFVTLDSTPDKARHYVCPPRRPYLGPKRDREKEIINAIEKVAHE